MSPTQNILTGATRNLITNQSGPYNVIENIFQKSHGPVSSEIVVGSGSDCV